MKLFSSAFKRAGYGLGKMIRETGLGIASIISISDYNININ